VLTGIVGVALFYEGLAEGAERAGAGPTAVLVNSTPFFVLVAGWVFLQERVTWRGILGLIVGFAGVVLIVSSQLGSDVSTSDLIIGSVLALAAAIGWGVTTLIIKWLVVRESSLDLVGLTAGQHVVGAVALVLLAVGIGDSGQATDWGSGELWGGVAFLAIGSSAIAYLAFFAALRRVEAAQASAWLFLVPVVAVVVELALGEVPDGIVLVGMALAIAGVVLISLFGQPKHEETSVPQGASPHGEHLS
jgi:drug/metabolite transporter (DMT)-like permease